MAASLDITSVMRLGVPLLLVLLASCGGGGCNPCAPGEQVIASGRSPTLLEQVTSRDYVAKSVSPALLLNPILVNPEDIDLSIDRKAFLAQVFHSVTTGVTNQQKVESWVRFLQDRIAHSREVPMHSEGVMLTDPVWILKNRVAQCGQTNRVLIDGLTAVGYKARTVQLANHIAAEVWYDGEWHFIDADWLNKGQFVRQPDGTLPSTAEIYANPEWLDEIDQNAEFKDYPVDIGYSEHRLYSQMFTRVDTGSGNITPFYLTKIATPEQEKDLTFGWNFYKVENN